MSSCRDQQWWSKSHFGWAQSEPLFITCSFKKPRCQLSAKSYWCVQLPSQLPKRMFCGSLKSQLPSYSTHFCKMLLELFYRMEVGQSHTQHIYKKLSSVCLKVWLITHIVWSPQASDLWSMTINKPTGRTRAFVEPVEFQSKGHSHTTTGSAS